MLIALTVQLNAQKRWTLEQCIAYAVENNISVKQKEISRQTAETDLKMTRNSRLPNLNANIEQNYNFGNTAIGQNQRQSKTDFNINSSVSIFSGFRAAHQIAKNKLDLQAATLNLEQAKEDLSIHITQLFLQVLLNKELQKINDEQFKLIKTQIERTKTLIDAGRIPQSQLFDIQSQAANDRVLLIQAENDTKLALLELAQNLEIQEFSDFDIVVSAGDTLLSANQKNLFSVNTVYENALKTKPAVKSQEILLLSAEKTLKTVQAEYYPTLSLNAGLSTNYFYLYNTTIQNLSFSDQIKNNIGEYISLNLSISVFNRFSTKNNVKKARQNIENQQLILENAKKQLYKEIQTAFLNALLSDEKLKYAHEAVKSTTEAFKYAQERYYAGKSSVFELNEARTRLVRSQTEETQAKFDYIFRLKILDFYNGKF